MENSHSLVVPGSILGRESDYILGVGVYLRNGNIYSTLLGKVVIESILSEGEEQEGHDRQQQQQNQRINVIVSRPNTLDTILSVGDIVIGQVTRIMTNQVLVEILVVGDRELKQSCRGMIRKEDVRLNEIDTVNMTDCFGIGDLVKASILSLGDSKQYYLSCAADNLGVIIARNENNGTFMISRNSNEMGDSFSGERIGRKVAVNDHRL